MSDALVPARTPAPAALAAFTAQDDSPPDQLAAVRAAVARVRELRLLSDDLGEKLTACNKEIGDLTRTTLPDAFAEAGLRRLDLDASGNLPAYVAQLKPYYKAVISAEWSVERQNAAFDWLAERDAEDLVKTTITVELGMRERDAAKNIGNILRVAGVAYSEQLAVPWNSLTAWLKEQVEKHHAEFSAGDLERIGAQVGRVVEVQPVREKSPRSRS